MGDKRLTHSRVFRTERVASHAHRPPRLGQCMTLSAGWYKSSAMRELHFTKVILLHKGHTAASAGLLPKPVLSGKGRQEYGQDRLPGRQGYSDPAGWADLVWNELDQLCEHTQGMEMSFRQAVELLAAFVDGRVLPVHKAEE